MNYARKTSHLLFLIVFTSLCLAMCNAPDDTPEVPAQPGSGLYLDLLPAHQTGVDFTNHLIDTGRMNIFIWNFMYSGAGVGIGDVNGDDLPDLYFAGNQVPDRLYLNQGNFQFRDVTSSAGIADNLWSTGVSMIDINNDGKLDIYVCKNSPTTIAERNRNKLFINIGNARFVESAANYGLDDPGYSIQALFFDPDYDGDLDLYLINQPIDQFAMLINKPEEVAGYPSTDRFFACDDGSYVDRTAAKGLTNERYGLGISLADFDKNGWTDIYVSNDYHHADHLYMNYRGDLRDEIRTRTSHISFYSMGSDAGDINNDGYPDAVILDMAFPDHFRSKTNMESMNPDRFWRLVDDNQHYQYMHNTVQLNTGDGTFSEIANLSGVAKTDWSWATLLVDLDNDGLQDMLVTNGILRDMKNNDFREYVGTHYGGQVGPHNYKFLLRRLPSVPIANQLFRNTGGLCYEDISRQAGFAFAGFSHGMAYGDLDRDGRVDIVVNNMNAPAGIYRNTTTDAGNWLNLELRGPGANTSGIGITVELYNGELTQNATMQTTRGYMSSCEPFLHFGVGHADRIDSLVIYWNDREKTTLADIPVNQRLRLGYGDSEKSARSDVQSKAGLFESLDLLPFEHEEIAFDDYRDQVLLPYKLSQNGPFTVAGDVNGDGRQDIFIGGAAGQEAVIFVQTAQGTFSRSAQPALRQDAACEDQEAVLVDADDDGDLDLYVVSGSNEFDEGDRRLEDRLYGNDGSGRFTRMSEALPNEQPLNGQCVEVVDVNGDGLQDLFLGGRLIAGKYPLPPSSRLLVNRGGHFVNETVNIAPCLQGLGLVTDAIAEDVDSDGDQDLLVLGEWMAPVLLINNGADFECREIAEAGKGLWWSVAKGDVDNDGDADFFLGNLGWNNKFGGRKKATLEVYAGDFDNNGDHDILLANATAPGSLPVRGRECSSGDMPFVLDKFPEYSAFGEATVEDILSDEQRSRAYHCALDNFSSVILRNDGALQFESLELPVQCQTGPIKAFLPGDFNGDGNLDIVYAGNHYPTEVETARYDALLQGLALGDGSGRFTVAPGSFGGEGISGDVRDLELITPENGQTLLVVARNDATVQTFRRIK